MHLAGGHRPAPGRGLVPRHLAPADPDGQELGPADRRAAAGAATGSGSSPWCPTLRLRHDACRHRRPRGRRTAAFLIGRMLGDRPTTVGAVLKPCLPLPRRPRDRFPHRPAHISGGACAEAQGGGQHRPDPRGGRGCCRHIRAWRDLQCRRRRVGLVERCANPAATAHPCRRHEVNADDAALLGGGLDFALSSDPKPLLDAAPAPRPSTAPEPALVDLPSHPFQPARLLRRALRGRSLRQAGAVSHPALTCPPCAVAGKVPPEKYVMHPDANIFDVE